jgi:hypothetical protein
MITNFERVEEYFHVRERAGKRSQMFNVTTNPVYKIQRKFKLNQRSLSNN